MKYITEVRWKMSKVWLVTGAARGLGRSIVEAILDKGERVLATARNTAIFTELEAQYPEQFASFELDVTHPQQAQDAIVYAVQQFGRLDVLVNNAGYGEIQPFEHVTPQDFHAQIDTNFFGVVNMTRAAIAPMRKQGSGIILQVSSAGGRLSSPGLSAYQAAKWAVGGFSDVLALELAPFGIQVCTLEPGGMRTDWGYRARSSIETLPEDYQQSLATFKSFIDANTGHEVGDPERIAKIVVGLVDQPQLPNRLLLGSDALQHVRAAEQQRSDALELWQNVTLAADFATETVKFPN